MRTAIASRQSTTANGVARPMTAVRGAGYSSVPKSRAGLSSAMGSGFKSSVGVGGTSFNPFNMEPQSEESSTTKQERDIDALIYESAKLTESSDHLKALEKAKEAAKLERSLSQSKERVGQGDSVNIDLTYTVLFNLANCYEKAELYHEALQTYNQIIDNKRYAHATRLKVNIGNIYYKQEDFEMAVRCYRMALDQVSSLCKSVRLHIMRTIGITFIKMNRWSDAVEAFDSVLDEGIDVSACYNLCVCHYALGNFDLLKESFIKLITIPESYSPEKQILEAARLVVTIELQDYYQTDVFIEGLDFVISELEKGNWKELSGLLTLEKATELMKAGRIDDAVDILKKFEKLDDSVRILAYTNLSFVQYYLGDTESALSYAQQAVDVDPYNIGSLVNLSAVYLSKGEYELARDAAVRGLRVDVRCFEAMYNLALSLYGLGHTEDALRAFKKLHSTHPDSADVIWMVSVLNERSGEIDDCIKWFNFLLARSPTDIGALRRVAEILEDEGDETTSLHLYQEAFRYFPVDIDIVSKLAAYCVQHELYEKALELFHRASEVQPQKTDWKLMIGMCRRRMGEYQKALKVYLEVIEVEPENKKCLKYLIQLYSDLEMNDEYEEYSAKLQALSNAEGRRSARTARSARSSRSQITSAITSSRQNDSSSRSSKVPQSAQSVTLPTVEMEEVKERREEKEEEDDDWNNIELTDDMLPM
ncbi:hypothetical protein P9112_003861 [Eukaryota sp. TZLM1-RC]